jgi:hypothetical protein
MSYDANRFIEDVLIRIGNLKNIKSITVEFPRKNWFQLQLDDIIKIFGLTLTSIPNITLMFLGRYDEVSEVPEGSTKFFNIYRLDIYRKVTLFSLPNNYIELPIEKLVFK